MNIYLDRITCSLVNHTRFFLLFFLVIINVGCAFHDTKLFSAPYTKIPDNFGVLLMAHGGSPEWNKQVSMAVKPIQEKYKIEISFGMADAARIQKSVRKLEARGVSKISVVRLFVSGESWYNRTEQILGLRPGAPAIPILKSEAYEGKQGSHHDMQFWKIKTKASFALSKQGLVESQAMGAILVDRAKNLKRDPQKEHVLILAHGLKNDLDNEKLIHSLEARADQVRISIPFHQVNVETVREDWPDKRKKIEIRIRSYVQKANEKGRTVIILPFRVHGFGPYAEILEGLNYVSDGLGLAPHTNVTEWISEQILAHQRGPFRVPAY